MKKILVIFLSIVIPFSLVSSVYAGGQYQEKIKDEYEQLAGFYEEVQELFPEANIGNVPSFEVFVENKNERSHDIEPSHTFEVYDKTVNGEQHYLYVYDDGSFEMISLLGDSIFTGSSWYESSQVQMRWQYSCVTNYHRAYIKLHIYYNYLTESYYFGTPNE